MAEAYKNVTIETSHGPIGVMLDRANALLPFREASGVLDNGCGPAPVMSRLLQDYTIPGSCTLTCSDFSEGMIAQVRQVREDAVKGDAESAWGRVEAVVQNAMELGSVADGSVSHVTAGWVSFFLPHSFLGLRGARGRFGAGD